MNDPQNTPVSPQPVSSGNEQVMAIVAIAAGVISLCGVAAPIIGIPLGIIGIVMGYFGRKDASRKNLATIGIVLSVFGILLSCVPVGVIAVMRLLGPKIGNTFSTISSSLP